MIENSVSIIELSTKLLKNLFYRIVISSLNAFIAIKFVG